MGDRSTKKWTGTYSGMAQALRSLYSAEPWPHYWHHPRRCVMVLSNMAARRLTRLHGFANGPVNAEDEKLSAIDCKIRINQQLYYTPLRQIFARGIRQHTAWTSHHAESETRHQPKRPRVRDPITSSTSNAGSDGEIDRLLRDARCVHAATNKKACILTKVDH